MSLISVVIPCRNEEDNVVQTIAGIQKEFESQGIDYEIIIINDGSTDGTARRVEQRSAQDEKIRLVHNHPPYGFGNAIRKGLEEYKGDYVIIVMADASDDPKDMVHYVEEMQKGYDCCFGNRWGNGSVVKNYPQHKLLLNRLANLFIRFLFQLKYGDVSNAFKSYSRETINGIKPLLSHHFNITVELPLKAIIRGYRYAVVPTNWYGRKIGASRLKIKEMGSRYLFIILYIWLERMLAKEDYRRR